MQGICPPPIRPIFILPGVSSQDTPCKVSGVLGFSVTTPLTVLSKGKEREDRGVNPLLAGIFGERRMREETAACADRCFYLGNYRWV